MVPKQSTGQEEKLAIQGGTPVRGSDRPLPLEHPGIYWFDSQEEEAALRVIRSRSLFRFYGLNAQNEVEQFEREMAAFIGVRHALATASGTGALHVAMAALGVGPGQEVIIPAYLWVATAAAVVNRGAIPVIADVDGTFCLDPADVARKITPKTAGILMVHMSGAPGDAVALRKLADEHKIFLVEDCAQCAGGAIGERRVGSFGDMAIFSFQTNKNMTAGEGGCVVTNNTDLYRRAVAVHDLGYPRSDEGRLLFNDMALWGMGYRMDELRASILRVQLRKLPVITGAMARSKRRIRRALERFKCVQLRQLQDPAGDTGCFLITTYADAATAAKVKDALRAEGIVPAAGGISNVLMTEWGLHLYYNCVNLVRKTSVDASGFPWTHPANKELVRDYSKGTCPVADSLFDRSILLAIPSCLSPEDEDDIIAAHVKVLSALKAGTL